jgi:metallo-beta-lactamase family protein
MKLEFWGAARTVTGSMHLLEANGRRILLDCGMFQGRRKRAFSRNRELPFDAAGIDSVLLSHAHIDHCGNLPTLVRAGFRGQVHATSATRDIAALMLLDSAKIQRSDVRRVNRIRSKQGKRPFEPLYTPEDVVETLERFVTAEYGRTWELFPGVRIRFIDAGHILGSASIVIDVEEAGSTRRLLFSGDIGRRGLPILRDPEVADGVDFVIMESTYGTRDHEPPEESDRIVNEVLTTCHETGGKLLVPSFAVGRTQDLVYRLNRLWEQGELPPVDVFVDSPLGANVTEVFRLHPECYDAEARHAVETEADRDPLGFERLTFIRRAEHSRRLNDLKGPAIIISPSGMCEGGRILHHLLHHAWNPNTTILFVGYQATDTLGRKILEGQSPVRIFDRQIDVKARILRAGSFSAHADRTGLLDWAERVGGSGRLERVFLVHGEEDAAFGLAEQLRERGHSGVDVPERGASVEL